LHVPHMTTQYHFARQLYVRIGLKLHLKTSRFKNFPGGGPIRRAWVLTFGQYSLPDPPNQISGSAPRFEPHPEKILDPPLDRLWNGDVEMECGVGCRPAHLLLPQANFCASKNTISIFVG
jgi:hypothetical protein